LPEGDPVAVAFILTYTEVTSTVPLEGDRLIVDEYPDPDKRDISKSSGD
jgi:hypothetical protein